MNELMNSYMHSLCGVWFNSADVFEASLDFLCIRCSEKYLSVLIYSTYISKHLSWAKPHAGSYSCGGYKNGGHLKLPFRIYGVRVIR